MLPGLVSTLLPGTAICTPPTTTLSFGARPERTMRRPSTTGPSTTGFASTVPSFDTVSTTLRA
jgi:hypothetical protein